MVQASVGESSVPGISILGDRGSAYQPGVCNIGPAEIARRRRAGHVGLGATVGLWGGLLAVGAPPLTRLLGVFNFGSLGETHQVQDDAARARDRARATQIGLASLASGLLVGALAVLLPR